MADHFIRKYGEAATILFDLYDPSDGQGETAATHAAGDSVIAKDEGAEANTTNAFANEGGNVYSLALSATEMQAARIYLRIVDQTATKVWLDKVIVIETYGNASGQHAFDLDTATVTVGTNNDKTGYSLTQAFPTNFADLAVTASTGRVTVGTNNDKTGYSISGTITTLDGLNNLSQNDVRDALTLRRATAQAGAANSITLDASASATNDLYNGLVVSIISGTGAGQSRLIVDYNGTSKVADIYPSWAINPSSDSVFLLWDHAAVDLRLWRNSTPDVLNASGLLDVNVEEWADTAIGAATAGTPNVNITEISGDSTAAARLEALMDSILTAAAEGTPTTTVIQTDLSETTDDQYIGRLVTFLTGNAAGEQTDITDYTGSSGTITVTALANTPSAGDLLVIH